MAGAGAGETMRGNVEAWERLRLLPHVLKGVGAVSTATTVLGTPVACPVMVAPTGRATRFHPEGEAAVLAAVRMQGTIAVLPSSVGHALPNLAAVCPGAAWWSQIYLTNDRGMLAEHVARAREAGCGAIVLTVDLAGGPAPGVNLSDAFVPEWEAALQPAAQRELVDPGTKDLEWICGIAGLPVVVKGVLRADDAVRCVEAGARAVIVSNHGGNQLDGVIATADALPAVAAAIGDRAEIYVDGGIRSGVSVLKALSLGARAVLIGRPATQGLAAGGTAGLAGVLELLATELARAQRLCGASRIADMQSSLIAGDAGHCQTKCTGS